ncbi:uroporphyrinogen-III synthase [Sunxiuqinia sp. A32]|uniref:uroporphyrinogen-III synthase n=1 Tax=Sunxiuqinia sp. A32 TaxID=3461496 RepID=UPI0040459083
MQSKKAGNILKDKVIITTYPERTNDELKEILSSKGATVLSMPAIEISPLSFQLENASGYDWFVFTSKNAIKPFVTQVSVENKKLAALGAKTAEKLVEYNLQPTFIGSGKSAADFAIEFQHQVEQNEKILLVLGSLAPDTLQNAFSKKFVTDRINVYQTSLKKTVDETILSRIKEDQYDLIVVTSPSAVQSTIQLLNSSPQNLRFVCIGKITDSAIKGYGFEACLTSETPSYESIAEAIIEYFNTKNNQ